MSGAEKKAVNWRAALLNILGISIIATVIGGLGYLLFVIGRIFVRAFSSSSSEIKSAIIAGVLTVLVTVFSTILTKYFERKKEIEQEHRRQIAPIYRSFLTHFFNMINSDKLGIERPSEKELVLFMRSFFTDVLIWSSDGFIKEYSKFSRKSGTFSNEKLFERDVLAYDLEKILLAMRKDLGHKNKGLAKGDILSVFVTDLDITKT